MLAVAIHKRSSVFYNSKADTFIKNFSPKFTKKVKFILKIRKYPGENFHYISKLLNSLCIKTPEIVSYSKFSIETKNLHGESLEEFLNKNSKNSYIIDKFVKIIITLLENNIYSADLSLDNFIVKDNEIYALDLEDYKHLKLFDKKKFLRKLNAKIPEYILNSILKEIEFNKF
ncbi:MAG: RIO1 family regulatory kinase/ATPase [Cetobacterium sp.]